MRMSRERGFVEQGRSDDLVTNPVQDLARVPDSLSFRPRMLGVEWWHSLGNAGIRGDEQDDHAGRRRPQRGIASSEAILSGRSRHAAILKRGIWGRPKLSGGPSSLRLPARGVTNDHTTSHGHESLATTGHGLGWFRSAPLLGRASELSADQNSFRTPKTIWTIGERDNLR